MILVVIPHIRSSILSLAFPLTPKPATFELIQFFSLLVTAAALLGLSTLIDPHAMRAIWKNRLRHDSLGKDIAIGFAAWCISMPIVAFASQLLDLVISLLVQTEGPDQVAVRYFKSTFGSPGQMTIALFTILIMAPVLEEFLFRGCLQTFVKKRLGPKAAILISSVIFALFHFSPSQGISNFSLLPALFIFAGFLGFTYERQGSLLASITLHATFNATSALRILFLPEGPP
jgi:hypothetical protein